MSKQKVQAQPPAWEELNLMGGGKASAAYLHRSEDHYARVVRNPPGWVGTPDVHYTGAEEIYLIEGDLTFGDMTLYAGDYAFIPGNAHRPETRTKSGCLAVVIFTGDVTRRSGHAPVEPAEEWLHIRIT
jgi:hypothetical protein